MSVAYCDIDVSNFDVSETFYRSPIVSPCLAEILQDVRRVVIIILIFPPRVLSRVQPKAMTSSIEHSQTRLRHITSLPVHVDQEETFSFRVRNNVFSLAACPFCAAKDGKLTPSADNGGTRGRCSHVGKHEHLKTFHTQIGEVHKSTCLTWME